MAADRDSMEASNHAAPARPFLESVTAKRTLHPGKLPESSEACQAGTTEPRIGSQR